MKPGIFYGVGVVNFGKGNFEPVMDIEDEVMLVIKGIGVLFFPMTVNFLKDFLNIILGII